MTACPRCGGNKPNGVVARGSDRLYGTTTEMFEVVRCAGCGLFQLDPRPSANELSRFYPKGYWFDTNQSQLGRMAEAYRRIGAPGPYWLCFAILGERRWRCGPILDVGCGGGLVAGMLRERGVRAMGLDYSPEACRIAWEQHRVPAVTGNFPQPHFRWVCSV